jgi:hypothetical protein
MRDMNGGAQVAVEGLNATKSEGVGSWREPCARETLRNKCENGGRLGQNAIVGDQRRHATLWIDCEVFRLALIVGAEVEPHRVILRTCFLQCDVRGQCACTGSVEQLEHENLPSSGRAISALRA